MSVEITMTIKFLSETCCSCGILFAVTKEYQDRRRQDHNWFYCPNGHQQHYSQKSDKEIAEENARQAQAKANEANHALLVAQRERDAAIAAKKLLESRIHSGVCPCCNRTFANLAAHIKTKHKAVVESGKTKKQIAA